MSLPDIFDMPWPRVENQATLAQSHDGRVERMEELFAWSRAKAMQWLATVRAQRE